MSDAAQRAGVRRASVVAAFLLVLVVAVFSGVIDFDFVVFDDDINLIFNPHLGDLNAKAWQWVWTDTSYMNRYLPLGWLAFFGVFAAGGLEPSCYHATN